MAFGEIKKYALIHIFLHQIHEENRYEIYYYEKDRRFTARQAWKYISSNKPDVCNPLPLDAHFDADHDVMKQHGLNSKYCNRYMTFDYIR